MMNWPDIVPKQLASLRLFRLKIALAARRPVKLPAYLGSTLRGALAMAFRRMVCTYSKRSCDGCPVQNRCHYPALFETPHSTGSQDIRRLRDIPHPIVIEPPERHPEKYKEGDVLRFEIVLIGSGIRFLPLLVFAINEMAEHGLGVDRAPFRLLEILNHRDIAIYTPESGTLSQDLKPIPLSECLDDRLESERMTLRFLTPLRINQDGSLMSNPFDVRIFLRHACRRIWSLMSFHENNVGGEIDFRPLLSQDAVPEIDRISTRWMEWSRYSNRQKCSLKMGGLIGSVALKKIPKEWRPILGAASEVHVGKGTILGLGKIGIQ